MGIRVLDFDDGFSQSGAPSEGGGISTVATETIAASGTITVPSASQNLVRVVGDGAAVSASTTPFGVTPPANGVVITVMGTDGTNTVTLTHNDAADGCVLNGNATLGAYDCITLIYLETEDRYVELTRNF